MKTVYIVQWQLIDDDSTNLNPEFGTFDEVFANETDAISAMMQDVQQVKADKVINIDDPMFDEDIGEDYAVMWDSLSKYTVRVVGGFLANKAE